MNRLPAWFRQNIPDDSVRKTDELIRRSGLRTVCREAMCPNITECFAKSQATFMILGDLCTRGCAFCCVHKRSSGANPDIEEPHKIARAVKALGLKYAVITSVTRDDLSDGGAYWFAEALRQIRALDDKIKVELLVPDFSGDFTALETVVRSRPFVLAHNLETVKRLYPLVRPQADYQRSLQLLKRAKELDSAIVTKSSLMLGMGESSDEAADAMRDLRQHGCDILTLGQYLAPSAAHYPVKEFILPRQFQEYQRLAFELGFRNVLSGPKVRSSYQAELLMANSKAQMTIG